MANGNPQPRLTALAPQLLVDDLARAMNYYRKLGFTFGEPWGDRKNKRVTVQLSRARSLHADP
jgi:hypothetical protein